MAYIGGILLAVFNTIVSKGIFLALAKRGIRPHKWVAGIIHSAPEKIDSPVTWIMSGLVGLMSLFVWEIFHVDEYLRNIIKPAPIVAQTIPPISVVPQPPARQVEPDHANKPSDKLRTKSDITRILNKFPASFEYLESAKALLSESRIVLNNNGLTNGGSIQDVQIASRKLASKFNDFSLDIDKFIHGYDEEEFGDIFGDRKVLSHLGFHFFEYARVMEPMFIRRPENFDQAKWLLSNPVYLHERELLTKLIDGLDGWISSADGKLKENRQRLKAEFSDAPN